MYTVDTTTLTHDALGRMVEKVVGSTYTQIVYGPIGNKLALMNGQTLQKAYIPLPAAQAVYTSTGLTYYRHRDHLNSSRLATTPSRTLYSSTAYGPFGESYAQKGTTDISFTGQDQDTVTGLYDFMFRKYNPIQGRWLAPDPAGLRAVDPGSPQSWNRYVYVMNNPMSLIDPLGLFCQWDDGSSDPSDDPASGSPEACAALGGTWVDDWPGQSLGFSNPNDPNRGGGEECPPGECNAPPTPPPDILNATEALYGFLASCEGYSSTPYNDTRKNCTIGYGHLMHLGPCTSADMSTSTTEPAAMAQFESDVSSSVTALNNALSVPLNQSQFDAMVSLTFNMGMAKLQSHDVWSDVQAGNMAAVPADIQSLGAGGPGIPSRRANEANMFANGVYAKACYAHN
jgi:RHS repeat-associated protein